MLARLDRILFRWQSEGIVTHRMQHIEAAQSLVARNDVAGDVAERMPNVQACATGIREHVERIELRLGQVVLDAVGLVGPPLLPPLSLQVLVLVSHDGAKVEVALSVVRCPAGWCQHPIAFSKSISKPRRAPSPKRFGVGAQPVNEQRTTDNARGPARALSLSGILSRRQWEKTATSKHARAAAAWAR